MENLVNACLVPNSEYELYDHRSKLYQVSSAAVPSTAKAAAGAVRAFMIRKSSFCISHLDRGTLYISMPLFLYVKGHSHSLKQRHVYLHIKVDMLRF